MKTTKILTQNTLICFLSFMGFISQFSIESYLSGIYSISKELKTTPNLIQHTIIIFIFSYATSQLFYGPLSDYWGRKKALLLGFNIFGLGTIFCIFASDINIFIIGRVIQGVGIGASFALFRVVLSDHFQDRKLASINSLLSVVTSITPPLSPVIGAMFITGNNWRWLFVISLILTIFFIFTFRGYYYDSPSIIIYQKLNLSGVLKKYKLILKNYRFCGYLLCSGLTAGAINAYTIATPYIFNSLLDYSPVQYTMIFIFIAPSIGLGAYLNSKYVLIFGLNYMMKIGSFMMLISSLIAVIYAQSSDIGYIQIIIPSTFYLIGTGLLFPNIYASSIRLFQENHGMVAALYGSSQVLLAGLISELSLVLKNKLIYVNLIQCTISVFIMFLIFKLSTNED